MAPAPQHREPLPLSPDGDLAGEAGLPDALLAGQHEEAAPPGGRLPEPLGEAGDRGLAPDQGDRRREGAGTGLGSHLEAAGSGASPPVPLSAPNETPGRPARSPATIGEQRMTAAEFDQLIDALPEQVRVAARGPNKRQFAEQVVRIKILSQEAHKRKLDETPAVQHQIELQKDNLLANALFQDMTANVKVDDATEHQYFEEHKADYETVHSRHILIRMKGSPVALVRLPMSWKYLLAQVQGRLNYVLSSMLILLGAHFHESQ